MPKILLPAISNSRFGLFKTSDPSRWLLLIDILKKSRWAKKCLSERMLSWANFRTRLVEHVSKLDKVAQRSAVGLQWFVKLPIGGVLALAMCWLDCRPNMFLRKDLSIWNMCKFEKIPRNEVLYFPIHHDGLDFFTEIYQRPRDKDWSLPRELHEYQNSDPLLSRVICGEAKGAKFRKSWCIRNCVSQFSHISTIWWHTQHSARLTL
jgi:hypothetical protein